MLSAKRTLTVMVLAILVLTIGTISGSVNSSQALGPDTVPVTGTLPYTAHLTDPQGQAVAFGQYDFRFDLYNAPSGGQSLWTEVQTGVTLQDGNLSTSLGRVNALPGAALDNQQVWLEVSVRGPGEKAFTTLTPRQPFAAVNAVVAATLTCPHNHYGDSWSGTGSFDGLMVQNFSDNSDAIHVTSVNTDTNHGAIYARNVAITGTGDAINTYSNRGVGLRAGSGLLDGIDATTNAADKSAVYAHTNTGYGVYAVSGGLGLSYPNELSAIKGLSTNDNNLGGYFISNKNAGAIIQTLVYTSYVGLLVDGPLNIIHGNCSGCAVAYASLNAGTDDIRKGDLVAAVGVQVDAITQQPILLVKRATSPDDVVIGVATGTAASPSDPTRASAATPGKSGVGVTAAGEYVQVMLSGLAQVHVGSAKVSVGAHLAAGSSGAVETSVTANSIARVMSEPDADGLVWALISGL
jgi:hypothetical protein